MIEYSSAAKNSPIIPKLQEKGARIDPKRRSTAYS